MGAAEILTQHGTLRAAEVIELAAAAGLELAAAATMLQKESSGGHNVWGHDNVPTGGNYVKGAEVTREAYLNYKAQRAQLGSQGVGPAQLTWHGFQDTADARGGCWDWRVNCAVGFETLAGQISAGGDHGGFRAYNGSEAYANDAVAVLAVWRGRLGGGNPGPAGGGGVHPDYTVVSGDNLTKIARHYPEPAITASSIAAANFDLHPSLRTNPDHLEIGWVLRIR